MKNYVIYMMVLLMLGPACSCQREVDTSMKKGKLFDLKDLVTAKVADRDVPEIVALDNMHPLEFLKNDATPQARRYFEACIFDVPVTLGNVQLYNYRRLVNVNRLSEISTVAHKSGYLEFAQYEADGSRFYINPSNGKVFVLGLGAVDEMGIFGFEPNGSWGIIDTDIVDDLLMNDASWKSWPSLEAFWRDDLRGLSNAE